MTQPEALRLADALSAAIKQVDADDDVIHVARWFVEDAAAELSRLHAENERIGPLAERVLELKAQRDALLEALKLAVRQNEHDMVMTGEECRQCRAAIKAVEGELK